MGPLALLGLAGGIGGLASVMKKKGIDLKKKELAKKISKKKEKRSMFQNGKLSLIRKN